MNLFKTLLLCIAVFALFLIPVEKMDFSDSLSLSKLTSSVMNKTSSSVDKILSLNIFSRESTNNAETQHTTNTTINISTLQSFSICSHKFGEIMLFRASFGEKSYAPARDSITCYAQIAGYKLLNVDLDKDKFAKTTCSEFRVRNRIFLSFMGMK